MPSPNPIKTPAGYVPAFALGYPGPQGELEIVDSSKPLPVSISSTDPLAVTPYSDPAPVPLAGSAPSSIVAGPYAPVSGRPVMITLAGTWQGTVQIMRSTDGGATKHPVTVGGFSWGRYTTNVCEPCWEEQEAGAQLYLDISLVSGAVDYRIAQ
ncbi:MAG: hypothetical protein KDE32_11930 [Novosphingobium sp.]|nr:hypothetical protein [Novosphingobium sp.]